MSDLLIKGVDMLKHNVMHGNKDTIYRAVIRVRPDGTATITINRAQAIHTFDDGDLITAPLVEIPTPHGRLIDADALIQVIENNDYTLISKHNTTDKGMFTIGIKQAIDESPTFLVKDDGNG